MAKTIIIGAGGTGLKVIRHLRKYLVEVNDSIDKNNDLGYLYIDTNPEEVEKKNDALWQVLGKNIYLHESEYITLKCPRIMEIIDHIDSFEDISEWFPLNELKILDMAAKDTPGASQIRPLGRYAFYFGRNAVKESILNIYNGLNNGDTPTEIYICCSLSGGTGAGMFLDLAYSIREWIPNCEIYGFLVLPKLTVNFGDKYLSNAYAALSELNYYSLNKVHYRGKEVNVTFKCPGSHESYSEAPFDFCYLVTHRNKSSVELNQESVAQMIAERIYLNFDSSFAEAAKGLLNNGRAQRTIPLEDPNSTDRHSTNFFTFGLSKIKYPVDKIIDLIAYEISCGVYNTWLNDTDIPGNMSDIVTDELATLKLTDEYILYDTDLFKRINYPSTEKAVNDFISKIEINIKNDDSGKIINTIKEYQSNFIDTHRKVGVKNFYLDKTERVNETCNEMFKNIQNHIAKTITLNDKGLNYARSFMKNLRSKLDKKKAQYTEELKIIPTNIDNTDKNLHKNYAAIKNSCNKFFGKTKSITNSIEETKKILHNNLKSQVDLAKYTYGINLLSNLIDSIDKFIKSIDAWAKKVTVIKQNIEKTITRNTEYFNDLNENNSDFNGSIIFEESMLSNSINADDMESAIDFCKKEIFEDDYEKILNYPEDDAKGQNLYRCALNWLSTSDVHGTVDSNVVNILEKLYTEEEISTKMSKSFKKSSPFGAFDQTEKNIGNWRDTANCKAQIVGLLDAPDSTNLSNKKIKKLILNSVRLSTSDPIRPIMDKHEILFLQEITAFPLRFINDLKKLRHEYNKHYKKNNPLPLHIRKEFNPPLQNLYTLTKTERDNMALIKEAFVSMRALKKLTEFKSFKLMKQDIRYEYIDPRGNTEKYITLGSDWLSAYENYQSSTNDDIKKARTMILSEYRAFGDSLTSSADKIAFADILTKFVASIKPKQSFEDDDTEYVEISSVIASIYDRFDLKNLPVLDSTIDSTSLEPNEENFIKAIYADIEESHGTITDVVQIKSSKLINLLSVQSDKETELLKKAVKLYNENNRFKSLVETILSDGKINDSKRANIYNISSSYNLSEAEVENVISTVLKSKE